MPSPKSSLNIQQDSVNSVSRDDQDQHVSKVSTWLNRKRFSGAICINFLSFLLPALYGTLSKYWVSSIDTSFVVTVDSYTYIGVVAEVINEGLPRAAWLIIGDDASRSLSSRIGLAQTLILFQSALGLVVSLIILGAATNFAATFVPENVRAVSLTYVRLSAFSTFSSALEYATSNATRALDRPDVPLIISIARFLINIILDLLIISPFHVGSFTPSANIQAAVRLACDMTAAFSGLTYFVIIIARMRKHNQIATIHRPSLKPFLVLLRPGLYYLAESAIRNTLYLWLIANIVSMGSNYATAWGVFNTIRWGLIMIPVQTLEASSSTFIGHRWGRFRQATNFAIQPKATTAQIKHIIAPALISCLIALAIEIPLCIALSLTAAHSYAHWVSGSDTVAQITAHMWRTIDWCYIFYALSTQLATILLATMPRWYLYQSLASNLLYVLPWAIVCQVKNLDERNAWTYHSLVFGGSLVFSFFDVLCFVGFWAWRLRGGWGGLKGGKVRGVS